MTNFNMIKLDATASSNDWLKNRFLSGDCSDGDVVWVKNQTHGRGQMNKIWQSEPQKNLTFSLFKVFPKLTVKNGFVINFAVTLGVVKALEEIYKIDLKLKWPNDILSGENKIGGILIENIIKRDRFSGSIIGIGININQELFEGLPRASSLFLKTGYKAEVSDVLKRILKYLEIFFNKLSNDDKSGLKRQYDALLFQKGKLTTFKDNNKKFLGVIKGVTESGMLKVQKKSGEIFDYHHGAIEIIF